MLKRYKALLNCFIYVDFNFDVLPLTTQCKTYM